MKTATGIIAIMLGLLVLLQSCAIGAGSSLLGDQATADAGAFGITAGFFLFVGGAFSFGLPMIGGMVLLVAALVAFTGVDQFPDLQVWAVLALVLAAMSLFAWRSDRKRRQASSAANIEAGQREAGQ
ncbi:hypothetical protein JNB91_19705 [Rhizobium wenxiniae]|uniref:hypothetical protein n=1 Tax=Rhizobium wenxiniae TaxID=1737357 RepID=UPI001C6EA121|nr:hypothetical protein [Rhizobium wenxiniae]MBW9090038.1 hypothetical protein [Rhizobium wenxiniae]